MEFVAELEKLEDLYYGDWEEDKAKLIKELTKLHLELGEDEDTFNRFLVQSAERFGGAYIPHLFWDKLSYYYENPDERIYLQELLRAFSVSNFDEEEQKLMKPLLVTYIAREKSFELNKIKAQTVDKAHPEVKEYFQKLTTFVEKNTKATEMYSEKFELLKDIHPDFELLNLPITRLKERMKGA
ncbi:MAG: hypothetical protein AAFY71_24765 [Bacteroidota bacterium]